MTDMGINCFSPKTEAVYFSVTPTLGWEQMALFTEEKFYSPAWPGLPSPKTCDISVFKLDSHILPTKQATILVCLTS